MFICRFLPLYLVHGKAAHEKARAWRAAACAEISN